jgi:hypothetical protein
MTTKKSIAPYLILGLILGAPAWLGFVTLVTGLANGGGR